MNPLTRRKFVKISAIGAGALLTPALARSEELPTTQATHNPAADRVKLGKTGLVASRLAQGTGVRGGNQQSDHSRMGQEAFTRIIRHGFDRGLNFWDMADLYGTHTFMRNAMKGIDRDKYVVLSKVWTRPEKWNDLAGGATAAVNRFCKEWNTDVLDICLIHCMIEKNWMDLEKRVRDELSELKEKGKVRAVGCSCHSHDALKAAAVHPWVDVILARINHMGGEKYKMDGTVEEITATLKLARANGKTVVGMKIFGEGTLIKPEEKDASLKYVLNSGAVDAITIGMSKIEEVDDCFNRIANALRA